MLDLGAFINVIPTSVHKNLDLDPLQNTSLTIQMTSRSNTCLVRVVECVFIQVEDLFFLQIYTF